MARRAAQGRVCASAVQQPPWPDDGVHQIHALDLDGCPDREDCRRSGQHAPVEALGPLPGSAEQWSGGGSLSSWRGAAYSRLPVSAPRASRSPVRSGFLLAPLLLVCCAEPPPPEELRFRVGYPDLPSSLLIYVAQDARLFAAEHLRVESRVFASGREGLLATIAGELDATAVYSTPVVLAGMSGEDVVVLTHASPLRRAHWTGRQPGGGHPDCSRPPGQADSASRRPRARSCRST